MIFKDRREAGEYLAEKLKTYAGKPDVLVLGLPRGGVPVAFEVAEAIRAPLDVFIVRKLGVPGHEELAMGAIATGGFRFLNRDTIYRLQIPETLVDHVTEVESRELERREREFRDDLPAPEIEGRTIILVDDGLATGASMLAAVAAVRQQRPKQIIIAVPVGAAETCAKFRSIADRVVCVDTPRKFYAVGAAYADFSQTTDAEVRALLDAARNKHNAHSEDLIAQ